MNESEHAYTRARIEFEKNGVLSLTTVMELARLGFDVPRLEHTFEEEAAA